MIACFNFCCSAALLLLHLHSLQPCLLDGLPP